MRDLGGRERPVGAGEARDQVAERVGDRLGEGVGHAGRHGHAERVAQPGDVLDRCHVLAPAMRTSTTRRASASCDNQEPTSAPARRDRSAISVVGQRPEQPQQVGHALGVACLPVRGQSLQLALDLVDHGGVEQLAQLGAAEQLAEQRLVEGQSAAALRSASGESPS